MSNIFGNVDLTGMEEDKDMLGGGSPAPNTGVYPVTFTMAYLTTSKNGAKGMVLLFKTDDGLEREKTVWFTNRSGEPFYTKDGKKHPLPGYSTVDAICAFGANTFLKDTRFEEKQVQIWNREAGQKLPTSVLVAVDLIGKPGLLGLIKETRSKWKDGEPTAETFEDFDINKVFHPKTRQTLQEAKKKQTDNLFIESWITANPADKVKDATDKNAPAASGTAAKSGASAPGASPEAQQAASQELFG